MKSYFYRFSILQRLEHLVLILSFTTLAITGLAQKFATWGISQFIIGFLGGIESTRVIHRIAAIVFGLEAMYHILALGYILFVLRRQATMMLSFKDIQDAFQSFFYNLGLSKKHPKMGRYNFAEKAEYWALVWGFISMGVTGIILWNPISVANALPGEIIPAAKTMHGLEALLAVLAIVVWHFYHVHIKRFNWSMIKGGLSKEEMEEEHALELAAIEAGAEIPLPTPAERRKRMQIYVPVAIVFTFVSLFVLVRIVSGEQTAIETIPPVERGGPVFSPRTPTPLPTMIVLRTPTPEVPPVLEKPATWEDGIGVVFDNRCGRCHGSLGGYSIKTYAEAIQGGDSGAAILPGDAESSLVVQLMRAGGHPGKFADAELEWIVDWINAGAPEK